MLRFRSILSLIVILITTLLVSCGGPKATVPQTYTADTIAQIQTFLTPVETARKQMSELAGYVRTQDWFNVESLIHGPLGQLRHDVSYISRSLLPTDQKQAKEISKELFFHIEQLDAAAKEGNYELAVTQFNQAVEDFDAFLDLVPTIETQKPLARA